MAELVKTCENCEYEFEDIEGRHCKHCIHNATENFEPKKEITKEAKIRSKAIDDVFDFLKTQRDKKYMKVKFDDLEIRQYKEQLKAGVK